MSWLSLLTFIMSASLKKRVGKQRLVAIALPPFVQVKM
jgi:hypothetical protein